MLLGLLGNLTTASGSCDIADSLVQHIRQAFYDFFISGLLSGQLIALNTVIDKIKHQKILQ